MVVTFTEIMEIAISMEPSLDRRYCAPDVAGFPVPNHVPA